MARTSEELFDLSVSVKRDALGRPKPSGFSFAGDTVRAKLESASQYLAEAGALLHLEEELARKDEALPGIDPARVP